jgi:hypothetical protein
MFRRNRILDCRKQAFATLIEFTPERIPMDSFQFMLLMFALTGISLSLTAIANRRR